MTEFVKWLWIILGSALYFGWYAIIILAVWWLVLLVVHWKNEL